MENNYLWIVLVVTIVIGFFLIYRFCAKKYHKKQVYQAKLRYFDKDSWYCHINYGSYIGRGFVSLPQEGHFVGEEVEVEFKELDFVECFVPVNSGKQP